MNFDEQMFLGKRHTFASARFRDDLDRKWALKMGKNPIRKPNFPISNNNRHTRVFFHRGERRERSVACGG